MIIDCTEVSKINIIKRRQFSIINLLFLAGYTLRQRKYVNEICEASLLTFRKQFKLN